MINDQLITYINKALSEGTPKEAIETTLLNAGWKKEDIDSAFSSPSSGLPDWKEILKLTFELYKSKAIKIICLYVLAFVFIVAIFGVAIGIIALYTALLKSFTGQGLVVIISIVLSATGVLIAIFSAAYLSTWPIVASIFIVGNDVGIKDSLRGTKKMVWKYYWANVLVSLFVLAGIILLIIPGVVFAVWLSLTGVVLIYENLDGVSACVRSRQLVSKNFWWVFKKMAFLTLITTAANIAIKQPVESLVLTRVILLIYFLFVVPFTTIYSYLIYKSLRDNA